MSMIDDEVKERPASGLYVSDAELTRRLGVGEKTARMAIHALEHHNGFPPKDPLFGGKRYWPAVQAFLDRRHGLTVAGGPFGIDGVENFTYGKKKTKVA